MVITVTAMADSAGSRLRAHRERLGLSLRAAARELGCTHVAWMAWEADEKSPSGPFRDAIEEWSGGDVPADAWPLSDRERAVRERIAEARAAREEPVESGPGGDPEDPSVRREVS